MTDTLAPMLAPFEVKALDDDARTFEGLAATWDLDLGGDVIHKGAFRRTLAHWKKSKKVLPLLDSHQSFSSVRSVVGKLLEAKETDDGLEARFEMIEGPDGEEVFRRVKGGFVDGLSIGYEPVKFDFDDQKEPPFSRVRNLREVKLREISVVLFPMNPGATIDRASVKALLGKNLGDLTADELEELKRLHTDIGALLPAPEPVGLAPENPERLAVERALQALTLHRPGTR